MKTTDFIIDQMNSNDHKRTINYDFQGWPEKSLNIRDFIIAFGGKLNPETNKWEIDNDDVLDIVPKKMEDDGMGYGVHEEYFISAGVDKEKKYASIFVDKELDYITVWEDCKIHPGMSLEIDGKEWMPCFVDETDDGMIMNFIELNISNFEKKTNNYKNIPIEDVKRLVQEQYYNKEK